MSKKEYTQSDATSFLFAGFAVGVLMVALIIAIIDNYNPVEYDKDCLDNLANEICIEEGYAGSGEDPFISANDFHCYENNRQPYNAHGFDYLEGEKDKCLVGNEEVEEKESISKGELKIEFLEGEGFRIEEVVPQVIAKWDINGNLVMAGPLCFEENGSTYWIKDEKESCIK